MIAFLVMMGKYLFLSICDISVYYFLAKGGDWVVSLCGLQLLSEWSLRAWCHDFESPRRNVFPYHATPPCMHTTHLVESLEGTLARWCCCGQGRNNLTRRDITNTCDAKRCQWKLAGLTPRLLHAIANSWHQLREERWWWNCLSPKLHMLHDPAMGYLEHRISSKKSALETSWNVSFAIRRK